MVLFYIIIFLKIGNNWQISANLQQFFSRESILCNPNLKTAMIFMINELYIKIIANSVANQLNLMTG